MKDRTTPTLPARKTPVPMPGRLAVDFHDDLLKAPARGRLDEQGAGTRVSATGTFTRVRYLDPHGGRVHAILTDADGDSALIDFPAATVALVSPLLAPGTRVTVRGLVTGATRSTPAFITAYNAQIAGTR